jgi:hypothetical protein
MVPPHPTAAYAKASQTNQQQFLMLIRDNVGLPSLSQPGAGASAARKRVSMDRENVPCAGARQPAAFQCQSKPVLDAIEFLTA